jgi:hypothetical protein
MTRREIAYETVHGSRRSGLCDPLTRRRFEFRLPPGIGCAHIVGNGNTANRWNSMRQMVILARSEKNR